MNFLLGISRESWREKTLFHNNHYAEVKPQFLIRFIREMSDNYFSATRSLRKRCILYGQQSTRWHFTFSVSPFISRLQRPRRSKANQPEWWLQLVQNSEKGKRPLLFVRRAYCPLGMDGNSGRGYWMCLGDYFFSSTCGGRFINKDVQSEWTR